MKFENMNNQLRRKGKDGGLAIGMILQTESLLQSRELKIAIEKQATGELKTTLEKFCLLKRKSLRIRGKNSPAEKFKMYGLPLS